MVRKSGEITVAKDGTTSGAFQVPDWAIFIGLLIPAMDDGSVGVDASVDGTNFYPILDPADGDDVLAVKSGSDPGFIDISDYIRFLPVSCQLRITCAAQTTAAVTITWYCRG